MMWSCPQLGTYWEEVIDILCRVTNRQIDPNMGACMLHWFPHTNKTKVTSKFLDLGLLLAKRELTKNWKSRQGPNVEHWKAELTKWAASESTVRFQLARRFNSEKALEAAQAWEALVALLLIPEPESEKNH